MKGFVEKQNAFKTYGSDSINLDFHTIQHYGEESILRRALVRRKIQEGKGALTLIAQDCDSKCQIYVDSDILKKKQTIKF